MIILAAALASAQPLPSIDRVWLAQQVRIEAQGASNVRHPVRETPRSRPATPVPTATVANGRILASFENTIGM